MACPIRGPRWMRSPIVPGPTRTSPKLCSTSVPSFAGVPAFLRGSGMLASMPSLLGCRLTSGFANVPIPLGPRRQSRLAELPMYMAWHRRFQDDPAPVWLCRLLDETATVVGRSHAPGS